MEQEKPLKCIEFYSGIGGMHFAIKAANLPINVVAAFEINTLANQVYHFNFPSTSCQQRNIMSVTPEELESLDGDIWTMSPPCQPFTRVGNQKDVDDERTNSFMHLLNVIQRMNMPPRFIFLENVKGFECSIARDRLIQCLQNLQYHYRELLITPTQLSIPNSRLRYYLLASRHQPFTFGSSDSVCTSPPGCTPVETVSSKTLASYLEISIDHERYLIPDKLLAKYAEVLDLVQPDSTHSCCFTKAYGHYLKGTGSVLQCATNIQIDDIYAQVRSEANGGQKLELLRALQLRFFAPREISRLMGFPESFDFPSETSIRQRFQLLGNSVNVSLVSHLMKLLLL